MTSYWQTTWNSKLYDYQKLIADFKANRTLEVNNSKGLAKMKIVPHIGDVVFVSCDKKKIMTCSVISNFEEDNDGSYDEYCIGPRDTHKYSQNNIVLRLTPFHNQNADFVGSFPKGRARGCRLRILNAQRLPTFALIIRR